MKKKLITGICIYQNEVVKGPEDKTPISINYENLIRYYGDVNADEILVHDLSDTEEGREQALILLKNIATLSEIPVVVFGTIKRVEDVKKYLYTGCARTILNLSLTSNWEMLEEVSKRFGKSSIAVTLEDYDNLPIYRMQIENYASEFYLFGNVKWNEIVPELPIPAIVHLNTIPLDRFLDVYDYENVGGACGAMINENAKEINSLKALLIERGVEVNAFTASIPWSELKKNEDGLIPVITQDYRTGKVLMMAYMNEEAYHATLTTGKMTYFSRNRKKLWEKGETSGHFQYAKVLYADCDNDTLLAKVSQIGAACHTGSTSCFFKEIASKPYDDTNPLKVFEDVYGVIADRKINPKEGSYTNYLFDKGIDKILKKVGEEATEIVIAAKNPETNEIKYEISDFLYHVMVLMVERGVTWEEITKELARR